MIYQYILKRIFFLIDPEKIHVAMLTIGEILGKLPILKNIIAYFLVINDKSLQQKIDGIVFNNPIGLASGFDYNAQLTQILSSLGFGFNSVGTITNLPYKGNPKPMLGRLPKSQSLMVNKGYKNLGAIKTIDKLVHLQFSTPLGISIGRTNIRTKTTQKQSVDDIINSFKLFENSSVTNSYYELNISCPNLYGDIEFYSQKNLNELLSELNKLHIKKPVFVKMPIEKSNSETLEMLYLISKFNLIKGVIIGNLQKNRKDPSFDQNEIMQFKVGNFSGKPCEKRSNELIQLTYKTFKNRFIIIGCGGVFSSKDAYQKIKLGASLIQLITGMIYNGPTLISQINLKLIDLLQKDRYKNIKEAVGKDVS